MRPIYLDNSATTPCLPAVWEAMAPYASDVFGNPASAHIFGRRARQALEDARERSAALLGARHDEVIFTSGATEANNLALFALAGQPPGHIVVSPVEHPSVAEPVARLAELGFVVDKLPVDGHGIVGLDALPQLLRSDTRLLAVMLANNETGALQPIAELARLLPHDSACHCDAVQAVGKRAIDFHQLGVTTMSLSAHKFHGPKGVGALLVRRGTRITARAWGGHQQQGKRPGTEAVALAVGMARALELTHQERDARHEHVAMLRERFLAVLQAGAAPALVNGPDAADRRLPHTLNVSFPGCQADVLLMNLDLAGIACSTGSACSSGSLLPSPVLQAMGVPPDLLHSAMRFSFSHLLTLEDVEGAAQRVANAVRRLRTHNV